MRKNFIKNIVNLKDNITFLDLSENYIQKIKNIPINIEKLIISSN
jgi:hypothetical protein